MGTLRVLVTGASGFVGAAVAAKCEDAGMHVRASGRRQTGHVCYRDYVAADLLQQTDLSPLFAGGIDAVVHSAGLAHQFRSDPGTDSAFMAVNVEGTARVLQASVNVGVKHFILLSSVSVYGSTAGGPCDESFPCRPQGIYMESKLLAEQRAIEIASTAGIRLTILRLATVYGEGDPGNVARLVRSLDQGRFIWIGKGVNRKTLIHRDDLARACVLVLQSQGAGTNVFNLAAPPCTMREIVEELAAALGKAAPRWHLPAGPVLLAARLARTLTRNRGRLARAHQTVAKWLADDVYDSHKFCRTFGFSAQVSLREGLQREVAWYRERSPPMVP